MDSDNSYKFLKKRHVAFLRRCLSILPSSTVTYDTSRMTVLYFALSGLDVLDALDDIPQTEIKEIIEWIYTLQLTTNDGYKYGGFRGGHCISNIFCSNTKNELLSQDVHAISHNQAVSRKECNSHNSANGKDNSLEIRINEGQIPAKILRQFAPARLDNPPPMQLHQNYEKIPIKSQSSSMNSSEQTSFSKHIDRDLDSAHITMTYTALASLVLLGDDLSRVDKPAVLRHVSSLQCSNGSFLSNSGGSENDLRFVYCAAVVCYLLGDMTAIDVPAALRYVADCLGYAGSLGQGALQESHGGSTYCGVAALYLFGAIQPLDLYLDDAPSRTVTTTSSAFSEREIRALVRWLVMRQEDESGRVYTGDVNELAGGLQGRPNKPADTCYTFWIGAALKMLGCEDLLEKRALQQFVLSTQDPVTGGLAKYSNGQVDGLHTYLGISGLAVLGLQDLREVHPALNITKRAYLHWQTLNMDKR
ncbi:geranylgeranyl transferase type-1 subunit beta [Hyalella azteca]|uniref:Geranylgeranyl transferase type-1 subunit beta n=1 Tax=Hyalella azteca TaxID=294128 RepID=A0A8B7PLE7_HYAAZ|nr:geranylgeranyl transferase type-1 subunit beta [Hyalella azteca]